MFSRHFVSLIRLNEFGAAGWNNDCAKSTFFMPIFPSKRLNGSILKISSIRSESNHALKVVITKLQGAQYTRKQRL